MKIEKFKHEVKTLKKFFELNCKDKHEIHITHIQKTIYKNEEIQTHLLLCEDCISLIQYSIDKLILCPHDPKPMCRKCSNPCYDKPEWKRLAKLMRYSGIKLGVLRIKNFFSMRKTK